MFDSAAGAGSVLAGAALSAGCCCPPPHALTPRTIATKPTFKDSFDDMLVTPFSRAVDPPLVSVFVTFVVMVVIVLMLMRIAFFVVMVVLGFGRAGSRMRVIVRVGPR